MAFHKRITVGDTTVFTVDYCEWLDESATLTAGTAVTTFADATISDVTALPKKLTFKLATTSDAVNQSFTVDLQITDTRGNIKNDRIEFEVDDL